MMQRICHSNLSRLGGTYPDRGGCSHVRLMVSSSQAVRASSPTETADHSRRMSSTSISFRLAMSSVLMSAWSCGRKETILVKISPSAVATRISTAVRQVKHAAVVSSTVAYKRDDRLHPVDSHSPVC